MNETTEHRKLVKMEQNMGCHVPVHQAVEPCSFGPVQIRHQVYCNLLLKWVQPRLQPAIPQMYLKRNVIRLWGKWTCSSILFRRQAQSLAAVKSIANRKQDTVVADQSSRQADTTFEPAPSVPSLLRHTRHNQKLQSGQEETDRYDNWPEESPQSRHLMQESRQDFLDEGFSVVASFTTCNNSMSLGNASQYLCILREEQ